MRVAGRKPLTSDRCRHSHLAECRDHWFGLADGILYGGQESDAPWLALLSHTSVTQIAFSSAESLAMT